MSGGGGGVCGGRKAGVAIRLLRLLWNKAKEYIVTIYKLNSHKISV